MTIYIVFQISKNDNKHIAKIFSNQVAAKEYIFESSKKNLNIKYTLERWQVYDEVIN